MEFDEEEVRYFQISTNSNLSIFSHKNRPRPEFAIRTSRVEKNPVTGLLEPYFPPRIRMYRIIAGIITLSVMVTHHFPHQHHFSFNSFRFAS